VQSTSKGKQTMYSM